MSNSSDSSDDDRGEEEEAVEIKRKPAWQRGNTPTYIVISCLFVIACIYAIVLYFGLTMPGPENEGSAGRKWRNFVYPNRMLGGDN